VNHSAPTFARLRRGAGGALALMLLVFALTAPANALGLTRKSQKPLVATGNVAMRPAVKTALGTLPSIHPYGVFVHFDKTTTSEDRIELLASHGLAATYIFKNVDVIWATGTIGDVRALTREPSVVYLEEDRRLAPLGDSAPWATRVRVAQEPVAGGPYFDGNSDVIDGKGIGVAVVDTGADATHPDLTDAIVSNIKVVCTTPGLVDEATGACFGPVQFVDVGNSGTTDSSSGHGTGVSGVVAGDGTASTGAYHGVEPVTKGTFTGVAPGASLHVYSVGEGAGAFNFTVAWDHMLANLDTFNPRIRVMNVSLGEAGGASYDPNSLFAKLIKKVVEAGIVAVVAAGNGDLTGNGGDGTADITTSFCDDPTPGVICVGSYSDNDTGSRTGSVSSFSSRGWTGDQKTWPDILAPGDFITVPCFPHQPICSGAAIASPEWPGFYSIALGTSFASPHIAGAVAMLLQADPTLQPPQVEDLLLDTALKIGSGYVADPDNPGSTHSFDKGAGLLDFPVALDAHGVANAGASSGSPDVRITDPADGDTFPSSASISVTGTASDGTFHGLSPAPFTIFNGDTSDLVTAPGAGNVVSLNALETTTGIKYSLEVADPTDLPLNGTVAFRLLQNENGVARNTTVQLTSSGASAAGGDAPASSVALIGNTIEFMVSFANLGNPSAGAPAHNVFVVSFEPAIAFPFTDAQAIDMAPSDNPPSAVNFPLLLRQTFLQYGRPYTILRADLPPTTPAAGVTLAVDGGAPSAVVLTGSSPNYGWSTSVGPLSPGSHTLTARLYLDAVLADTHQVTIQVTDTPPSFTYDVLITNPPDGSTVPNSTVEIRGLATTDDPSTNRSVTVQVTGGAFDSGEQDATLDGVAWTHDFNFGPLTPGDYLLTARFYVADILRDTDDITVHVEPETSCHPRSIGYWRQQFWDPKAQKFTNSERETLAKHAVQLSDGYFTDRNDLVDALNASGTMTAEARAARQFAALLLNLAAGDLSSSMSQNEGLSGDEILDPTVYNTAVVGTTVQAASDWVRDQLPSGNLGGANEVADAINNGQGLASC
jgi:serine protease AprX